MGLALFMAASAFSQFTRQQAIDLVLNTILSADTGNINVYCAYEPKTSPQNIFLDTGDSVACPYPGNWVFFSDDDPSAFWAHQARFIFVNTLNGNYSLIEHSMLPVDLYSAYELVKSISYPLTVQLPEYTGEQLTLAEPNDHLYAVLVGTTQQPTFWYNTSMIYNTLIDIYGYKKENIFVHFHDGTGGTWNSDDLDGPVIPSDDIDYASNLERFDTTFYNLSGKWNNDPAIPELGPDDQLLVHLDGHGDSYHLAIKGSFLYLLNNQLLFDSTLARYLKDVKCSQLIVTMQQCFSGGFIDDLKDFENYDVKCKNRYIASASDYDETARYELHVVGLVQNIPIPIFGEFDFYLYSALRGWYPDVIDDPLIEPWETSYPIGEFPFTQIPSLYDHPADYFPDFNDDNVIQMTEAFVYMNDFNTWSPFMYYNPWDNEHTDFPRNDYDLPFEEELLSPSGISGTIESSQSIPGRSYMLGGNLKLAPNVTLTLEENTELYMVIPDNEIYVGQQANLILQNNTSVNSTSSLNMLTVTGNIALEGSVSFIAEEEDGLSVELNNPFMDIELESALFENTNLLVTLNEFSLTNSILNNRKISGGFGNYIISNSNFNSSCIHLFNADYNGRYINITDNCNFTNSSVSSAIEIENYPNFRIENCLISGFIDGVGLYNCGYGKKDHLISSNTIAENSAAGINIYRSSADLLHNEIENNRMGIKCFDRSNIHIEGNNTIVTQSIRNNELFELLASEASFPQYLQWNLIQDDDNEPGDQLIKYTGSETQLVFSNNCWGNNFNPEKDLYPVGDYIWEPMWDCAIGSGTGESSESETLYFEARNKISLEDYTGAKIDFKQLVLFYPTTKFAQSALKELYALEAFVTNDFEDLKIYYNSEPNIANNLDLSKVAGFLANFC
ncbi:MAG: right-handed parallel beta-helix repeat-containing protein [Bacteroidales bacterium]|nr:right-handed parallel beta-helix repeat-containing protein [Bacteroidales bacterium]MCF8405920.1 right-handed parallel beta-helix repeat-containing protein [Bacteroidales bacterium]